MSDDRSWARRADRLGVRAVADGEPTRWYEELWSAAVADEVDVPWPRTAAFPPVVEHVAATGPGEGRRAVVVGAGLGADAEHLATNGWTTTAFDIAPSSVDLVRRRYPDSAVDYRVADLLDLPDDLLEAFDLVVDVVTVQALHPSVRGRAVAAVRSLVAPGGTLLSCQFVRERDEPPTEEPPWLLDEDEIRSLESGDVRLVDLDRRRQTSTLGGADVWVALLHRDGAG